MAKLVGVRSTSGAGTDKAQLLSATIWLADMSTFTEMNKAWDAWVSPSHTPARAPTEAAAFARVKPGD